MKELHPYNAIAAELGYILVEGQEVEVQTSIKIQSAGDHPYRTSAAPNLRKIRSDPFKFRVAEYLIIECADTRLRGPVGFLRLVWRVFRWSVGLDEVGRGFRLYYLPHM